MPGRYPTNRADAGYSSPSAALRPERGHDICIESDRAVRSTPRLIGRLLAFYLVPGALSEERADLRNHNPNQLRLPFSKEEIAAAFLIGTFSAKGASCLVP